MCAILGTYFPYSSPTLPGINSDAPLGARMSETWVVMNTLEVETGVILGLIFQALLDFTPTTTYHGLFRRVYHPGPRLQSIYVNHPAHTFQLDLGVRISAEMSFGICSCDCRPGQVSILYFQIIAPLPRNQPRMEQRSKVLEIGLFLSHHRCRSREKILAVEYSNLKLRLHVLRSIEKYSLVIYSGAVHLQILLELSLW
ncbi:hypothetical protein CPB83DRAFT_836001 [Crepidotus variabilis]|uniref:Uncharacterized protein n=1 Tax=Crepidotus variabilis TaxID=179855 RepID=A0A9P6EGH4_9AGAR|nr:hypothetical protein CPB83DRAFT_836001 [Crepidotus variabilis]